MGRPGRPKTGTTPESQGADDRRCFINMRGTAAYAAWFHALHRATNIPKTTLVRVALAEWARSHGHPAPPEI